MEQKQYNTIIAYIALLITSITAFYRLDFNSLWLDEVYSVLYAEHWNYLWEIINSKGGNSWFYYVLLHLWLKLGNSDAFVRSLSGIFAVLTVPMFYFLGKRLFGLLVGSFASLLLAVSQMFFHYAREARGYSLMMLLIITASYMIVRGIEEDSWWPWIAYTIFCLLAISTHYFATLIVIAHGCSLIFLKWRRLPLHRIVSAYAMIAMGVAVYLMFLIGKSHDSNLDWVEPTALRNLRELLFLMASGGYHRALAFLAIVVLCVVIAVLRWRSRHQQSIPWNISFLICWFLLPIFLAFTFSVVFEPVFVPRYLIGCLPAFLLLTSLAVVNTRPRWVAITAALFLIGLSAFGVRAWYYNGLRENWRGATLHVANSAQRGDVAVVFAYYGSDPFKYYLRQFGVSSDLVKVVSIAPPGDNSFSSRLPNPDLRKIDYLSRTQSRLWLLLYHYEFLHLKRNAQAQMLLDSLNQRYQMEESSEFGTIKVFLYNQETHRPVSE